MDGENVVGKVDDLLSDTTKLETYATGKNPTIKKLLKSEQKKKYVNKLHDDVGEQADYIEKKTGHMAPEHLMDEPLPDDFASGGRVPLRGGKFLGEGLPAAIAYLRKKFGKDIIKKGELSKPMAPKTELKRAIAGFQERENIAKELESFRGQVDDNIIREISAMEPAQQLKAIEDVKLYIRNRKNLKQDLMLQDFDVTGKTPHASGGRVSLSNGGLAGMLGE